MKHKINPTVDCVFKAILGNEKRKHLLIHFLNSVLEYHENPEKKIVDVFILNPVQRKGIRTGQVRRRRCQGSRLFRPLFSTSKYRSRCTRVSKRECSTLGAQSTILNWERGDDYTLLQPVISVWIVTGVLFADTRLCHLSFYIENPGTGLLLNEHFALHVLQLPKWKMRKNRTSEKDRWIYLFKEGKNTDVDDPPDILKKFQGNEGTPWTS